jgi:hypothetical protein
VNFSDCIAYENEELFIIVVGNRSIVDELQRWD